MPFPLGRIYNNSVRGAAENGKISKVLGSQLMTALAIILIVAMVILIVFWSYIKKQSHWGRYILAIGMIGGIILGVAVVSSYVTKQQTESLFTGSTEKMIDDLRKYEKTSDITPNPALGGYPSATPIYAPPNVQYGTGIAPGAPHIAQVATGTAPVQSNYDPANPTVVQIPSTFVAGLPHVQPQPQPPMTDNQMQVVQIGNSPTEARSVYPTQQFNSAPHM